MSRRRDLASPLYFGPEGAQLFGWFHAPPGAPTGPVVVICPPIGFSLIMSHRGLRHLAESAAAAGMPTIRFDYHGTGDSAGSDLDPGRVEAWIASVGHAVEEARRLTGAGQVALIGVRMGSLLASYAAAARTDIAALVAWAPAASGRSRARELRALEQLARDRDPGPIEPGEPVVAEGFVYTPETMERLGELDVTRLPRPPAPRILVVPRDDLPDDDKFGGALHDLGAEVTRTSLKGFDMMMRDPHATEVPEEAIGGILEWLRRLPAAADTIALPPVEPVLRGLASTGDVAIEEQPFCSDQGRLFGVLARPAAGGAPGRPAIILVNAGAVHHIGSNRLHVTMARSWAGLGYPVLRLDLGGLGDSPPVPGMAENEPYPARAVADIGEAVAALRRTGNVRGVVLAGLCAGAHAAFHAALELEGIVGVMLINPIVLYWTPSDALAEPAWSTHHRVNWYRERVMRGASWRKLLRGEVDVLDAFQTVGRWMWDRTVASARDLRRQRDAMVSQGGAEPEVEKDLASICSQGVDVALLFSRGDPGLGNLRLDQSGSLRRLRRLPNFAYHEIPVKGHTFATIRAQRMLLATLTTHLQQQFGQ